MPRARAPQYHPPQLRCPWTADAKPLKQCRNSIPPSRTDQLVDSLNPQRPAKLRRQFAENHLAPEFVTVSGAPALATCATSTSTARFAQPTFEHRQRRGFTRGVLRGLASRMQTAARRGEDGGGAENRGDRKVLSRPTSAVVEVQCRAADGLERPVGPEANWLEVHARGGGLI